MRTGWKPNRPTKDAHLAIRFAVTAGLGMLLGLERERNKSEERGASVGTFALISPGDASLYIDAGIATYQA